MSNSSFDSVNFPLVSVGVLSYNNANYIIQTLDSLKSQSYVNLEVLINDDGSRDNSVEVINNWLSKENDIRFRLIVAERNVGVCASLNRLVQEFKGQYVSFIGSDDYYEHKFISRRVQLLNDTRDDVGLCYSWTKIIYQDGSDRSLHHEKRPEQPSGFIFEEIAKGVSSLAKPFTMMIKRTVFDDGYLFDENLLYEDLDWFLRVAKKYQILFFDSYDTVYREQKGTLGTKIFTTPEGIESQLRIVEKHVGYSEKGDHAFDSRLRFLFRKAWALDNRTLLKVSKFRFKNYPSLESFALHLLAQVRTVF